MAPDVMAGTGHGAEELRVALRHPPQAEEAGPDPMTLEQDEKSLGALLDA